MKGILDPDGVNLNPLNDNEYSDNYKKLANIWKKFPAYEIAKDAINDISNNKVILVVSGTGSGKTVLFPKYALHYLDYKGKIAITLPKQMIAKSAAEFSAKTLDVNIGDYVGYQYKGESKKSSKTRLLYVTDGTLVARLLNDPELKDFDMVIIDEAHERKIQIDFLLYLLRNTLKMREDFKVIIMSATINADIFKNYFYNFKFKQIDISSGTHYPIDSIYLQNTISSKDYINKGNEIINKILSEDPNDILFFVTSINETKQMCNKIRGDKKELMKNTICIEVYSGINKDKQELAQDETLYKKEGYNTKLVISTNVAESSLTIAGIKYVIDSGYELSNYFDPIMKANRLDKMRITKAQVKQRKGRAGRTAPGICYHLYTEKEYDNMDEYPKPDIRVADITEDCLRLMKIAGTTKKLLNMLTNFIEPPREVYIRYALDNLIKTKLIKGEEFTPLGELVSKISGYTFQQSISIICGIYFRCSQELQTIFTVMNTSKNNLSELFVKPEKALEILKLPESRFSNIKKEHMKFVNKFKSSSGDHMSVLKIYNYFKKKIVDNKQIDIFLNKKLLLKCMKYRKKSSYRREVYEEDIKDEHLKLMGLKNIESIKKSDIKDRILLSIAVGHRHNLAKKIKGKGLYKIENVNLEYNISKDSYLYNKEPSTLIYSELFIYSGRKEIKGSTTLPNSVKNLLHP